MSKTKKKTQVNHKTMGNKSKTKKKKGGAPKGNKYAVGNKGGHPTLYKGKETIEKAEKYLEGCEDKMKKVLESTNKKTGRKRYLNKWEVNVPLVEGLALYLEVHRDTLYEWAKKHKEFSDVLKKLRYSQANKVFNKALAGEYNPHIAKLLLSKHGYTDKQELKHSGGISLSKLLDKADDHEEKEN